MRALGADDAQLELAREHAVDHVLRRVDAQRRGRLGVHAAEADEQAGQQARARPGRGADREVPADGVGLGAQGVGELLLEREHALGADQHGASCGRGSDLAARAVEQPRPEPLLERAHGERDGGLGDAEVVRGDRERSALDHCHEGCELAGVH